MSKKHRLTAIKIDKNGLITGFGYYDHNSHKTNKSNIVFNCESLVAEVKSFLRGLIERHYPYDGVHDFSVNQISIDYAFDEPIKLTFSLKFTGEETGEINQSFPSLPHQILERDSDLIEALSDSAIEAWNDFAASLPQQSELDLFPLPELFPDGKLREIDEDEMELIKAKARARNEPESIFAVAPIGHDPKTFDY